MRTIETKVYSFNELSEGAQQTAINKLSNINIDYDWWDFIYGDAANIGLKITSFDLDRNRHATGEFLFNAHDCAEAIIKEHGKNTETYKEAVNFLAVWDNITNGFEGDEYDKENEIEEISEQFLKDILECYSIMLQTESEYITSDEAIIDTIKANEYEFTEEGKLI